ncbi:MAG: hypothetical protein ACO3SE_07890 [Sedimenticolaceae bacterium]
MGPRNWEEAMDELAEEKNALWECLDNIVALWDMEASMSEIENAMSRARAILANTKEELK